MALGPTTDGTPRIVPPVLYVPMAAHPTEGGDDRYIVRTMRDGRDALLVYTALDRLLDLCGDQQPWKVMPTAELEPIMQRQPFDVVLFDVAVPEHAREGGRVR